MKIKESLILASLAVLALLAIGCGPSVPVNPTPTGGSNPHVEGTPQERIERIQADSGLTPEEKERRISVIKERNNLK